MQNNIWFSKDNINNIKDTTMVKFFKYILSGIAIGTAIYTYHYVSDSKEIAVLLVTSIGAWIFSIMDDIDSDAL
jgi:hypothetical protein